MNIHFLFVIIVIILMHSYKLALSLFAGASHSIFLDLALRFRGKWSECVDKRPLAISGGIPPGNYHLVSTIAVQHNLLEVPFPRAFFGCDHVLLNDYLPSILLVRLGPTKERAFRFN